MKIGIDLGSRNVKVIKWDAGKILSREVFDAFQFYTRFLKVEGHVAQIAGRSPEVEGSPGLKAMGEGEIMVTGYGKFSAQIAAVHKISEIEAHVRGAVYQTGLSDFTLLDIGGQDTKVVKVTGGQAQNFSMNDKCAAGSGRFLENMCRILDISLEELAWHSGEGPVLNATCAIFAESELISKIIEGYTLPQLCAGVNCTLLLRASPMIKRHLTDKLVFVGGVAKSPALKTMLEREFGVEVIIPADPQFNGAMGCVLD
jgi:predicted CoA-substrate-specific enzyme activase